MLDLCWLQKNAASAEFWHMNPSDPWLKTISPRHCVLAASSFAFNDACQSKLNAVLKAYEGTHNFHNFTPRMAATDPTAKRYILNFPCPGTVTIQVLQSISFWHVASDLDESGSSQQDIPNSVECLSSVVRLFLQREVLVLPLYFSLRFQEFHLTSSCREKHG